MLGKDKVPIDTKKSEDSIRNVKTMKSNTRLRNIRLSLVAEMGTPNYEVDLWLLYETFYILFFLGLT